MRYAHEAVLIDICIGLHNCHCQRIVSAQVYIFQALCVFCCDVVAINSFFIFEYESMAGIEPNNDFTQNPKEYLAKRLGVYFTRLELVKYTTSYLLTGDLGLLAQGPLKEALGQICLLILRVC